MTNNLHRRVFEHKTHRTEGFSDHYNATRLVYWQSFDDMYKAIAREKQLNGWRREKKLWLIRQFNPGWKDLAAGWYEKHRVPRLALARARDCARDDKERKLEALSSTQH